MTPGGSRMQPMPTEIRKDAPSGPRRKRLLEVHADNAKNEKERNRKARVSIVVVDRGVTRASSIMTRTTLALFANIIILIPVASRSVP